MARWTSIGMLERHSSSVSPHNPPILPPLCIWRRSLGPFEDDGPPWQKALDQIGPHGIAVFLVKCGCLLPEAPTVAKLAPDCTFSLTGREASGKDGPQPERNRTAETGAVTHKLDGYGLTETNLPDQENDHEAPQP